MLGIVKWFNDKKGYGFIIYNGNDTFVHYSQIISEGYKTLIENETVLIGEIIETKNGFQALNVQRITN